MKILHTADLHIGSALTARLPQDKVRQRKNELALTFEKIADEAVTLGAKIVIIAGDLFDTSVVNKRLCERIVGIISRNPAIDFLYLSGNHEKNALVESGIPLPLNLKLFGREWTYFTYGEVTFAGRSEMTPDMFGELKVDPSMKNFVVLHGAVGDRTGGDVIGIKELANRGVDYVALGHYHSYGVYEVDERCVAVYSGTPEGRGFDEAGDKGFVLIDTESRLVQHRFISCAKRRIHVVRLDVSHATSGNDVRDGASELLHTLPMEDIVRLELVGERPPELFPDKEDLLSRFKDRFYYFEVKDSSRTVINPEAYKNDKSLKGEFIRLCSAREDLSDEDREAIIRAGLAALLGEDIDI